MLRPEGTVRFSLSFENTLDDYLSVDPVLIEIITGQHFFRLVREEQSKISFYHSSPSNGTRVACAEISNIMRCQKADFVLCWSTKNLSFSIGTKNDPHGQIKSSILSNNSKRFYVTLDIQITNPIV